MITALLRLSLTSGIVPLGVGALGIALFVATMIRRPIRRWLPAFAIAIVVGSGLGFLIAWWLGDVENLFDVTLTFATRAWFAAGTAGVLLAVVSLWHARSWRIPVAIASIVVFGLIGGLGVNASVGEYPTVGTLVAPTTTKLLHLPPLSSAAGTTATNALLVHTRTTSGEMRSTGEYGNVIIPATLSHFRTTDAIVYLPPAALVADPPKLPVMIFLGGQPGSPQTVISSGEMPELMNSFARAHNGLAPIVVIPNQLGAPQDNPMCLDSPLGNVQTYLTRDVPNWIRTHLNVLPDRSDWTIAGFSEGGTCSIQLGTKFEDLFGSILDISGQVAPVNGGTQATIAKAFHGDAAAYKAASPLALLAAASPMRSTIGIFAVGQNDAKYGPDTPIIESAARAAGITVHALVSPGTAHDWYTERYGVAMGLPILARACGLTQ
jgi:S-formylglutathione hydrolase FrmB